MPGMVRKGHVDPTYTTYGNVGDLYINLETKAAFKCIRVITAGEDLGFITVYQSNGANVAYIWEAVMTTSGNSNSNVFVVTVDENNVPNKTWEEIQAAHDSGALMFMSVLSDRSLDMEGAVLPLSLYQSDMVMFSGIRIGSNPTYPDPYLTWGYIKSDGTANVGYNSMGNVNSPT